MAWKLHYQVLLMVATCDVIFIILATCSMDLHMMSEIENQVRAEVAIINHDMAWKVL